MGHKANFYITESGAFRNRVLYFRHDDWQTLCKPLVEKLSADTFQRLSQVSTLFLFEPFCPEHTFSDRCGGDPPAAQARVLIREVAAEGDWCTADRQPAQEEGMRRHS